jgi:hypothetical protein
MSNNIQNKRILFLYASSKNTVKLRFDREASAIRGRSQKSKKKIQLICEDVWAVEAKNIQDYILKFEPHIVHFSGHGSEDQGLEFENEEGRSQWVNSQTLSNLFMLYADHVECVVFNTCCSEKLADEISRHIDFVIGMNAEINDKASIEFSRGFYNALETGCSYKKAYEFGCSAIQIAGISEADIPEHLIPVIKLRNISMWEQILSEFRYNRVNEDYSEVNKLEFSRRAATLLEHCAKQLVLEASSTILNNDSSVTINDKMRFESDLWYYLKLLIHTLEQRNPTIYYSNDMENKVSLRRVDLLIKAFEKINQSACELACRQECLEVANELQLQVDYLLSYLRRHS